MTTLRMMGWMELAACMEDKKKAYKILVTNPERA
jgi:hypothetical protein